MGRRKIEIRAIKDDRNRSVTFLKRKGGLFKKAHELSVLCSVDVAVIIFGHNKKLYEFSSGDINETLRRYQYYGPPHEHKGPSDFKNKGGDDDDDDEDEGDDGSQKREDSLPPQQQQQQQQQHLMPPHMQHTPFQHVRQPTASASPPMPNGMFQQRHTTPQPPGMISRSNSRGEIRRPTSTIVPMQQAQHPTPPQNGYAYMPNPPIYNPHAAVQTTVPPPQPSPQPQYQQFQHQHQQQQQQPQQSQQQSHQQIQQAHQQFLQDQRQHPRPPPPTSNSLQPPPQPPPRSSPQPEHTGLRPPSPPERKHTSSKSQSIFTPIDEGGSVLARVFFGAADPPRHDDRKQSPPEIKPPPRAISQPSSNSSRPVTSQPTRAITTTSLSQEFAAPKRSDTGSSKGAASRPKLNLTIPSESEENESGSGSPRASDNRSANPERNHNGIVLPPPSPSASALLSAGASGPPNPFARPPPPTSQANSNAYAENRSNSNNLDTPVSALPSRYMEQSLIASPGGLFSDWDNWGRGGLNSAVLPSPLTFPTPADSKPPLLFGNKSDASGDDKRKADEMVGGDAKRVKT